MPKLRIFSLSLVSLFLLAAIPACAARTSNEKEHKRKPDRPAIFDTKADGEKQIADALKIASRDNKRILLKFGANWCPWCHQLHKLLKEDARVVAKLKESYELVLIDVDTIDGKKHNEKVDAKYGNPMKLGLPVLVVLDADGKQLTTQSTEVFEVDDHHDPEKVLAFLDKWAPPRK
jgi:thioredoxin-related protein